VFSKVWNSYVAGSALASTWRLHLAFNESVLQTRPVSASAEMTFNETFSATLSSDNVGILLIELRNLMDVTLAMGGLEVSPDSIRQFSGEEGGVVRLSGEALEGQLGISEREKYFGITFSFVELRKRNCFASSSWC
jgi:hypothetical protein